ncbi:putative ribonuclease H domain-containing protein [Arabidopsis thaliana]
MWRIWKGRNNLLFNHKMTTPLEIFEQALVDTKEWLDNKPNFVSPPGPPTQMINSQQKWSTPPRGWGKFQGRISAEEAECSALLWALQSTWALGYRHVVFEGDNCNITRLLNNNESTPRLQHYLQTIWDWQRAFTQVVFSFKPHQQIDVPIH